MFGTSRHRCRARVTPGSLPARPQFVDASYDAATLAFIHLHERIEGMPVQAQQVAWQRVMRTLASLPDPDLSEVLALD